MCSRCRFLSFFFFKQKTAYEMRISDLSSDVCSSDLAGGGRFIAKTGAEGVYTAASAELGIGIALKVLDGTARAAQTALGRSEEHTSELQSLMRISYAVFCLKKKKPTT